MFTIVSPPGPLASTSGTSKKRLPDELMLVDDDLEELGGGADGDFVAAASKSTRLAVPGEGIADASLWMRGHGTYITDERVFASVAGTLERVNKLVSVRALRTRYRPEVGDLVVGRIVDVGPKRWRVDCFASQNAILMLSSINLPGGVQRRKLESDELQMRTFFQEGDLLVAEVQAFFGDGAISLHTRSLKYGKLRNGQLVKVPPSLITRLKSHFHTLPSLGLDLIIGLNGFIWICKSSAAKLATSGVNEDEVEEDGFGEESGEGVYSSTNDDLSPSLRTSITLVSLLISLLSNRSVPISATVIQEAVSASLDLWVVEEDAVGMLGRQEGREELLMALAVRGEK